MTKKLIQKSLLKGMREFEIVDQTIFVSSKTFFKEEKITVDLSVLDPEPVIIGSELAFYSPHKGHPIFLLMLNKPNKEEFEHFVDALKQGIMGEDNNVTHVETISQEAVQEALARNIYEEPPEYDESGKSREKFSAESVNVERLEDDINMLKTYLKDDRYAPLFNALETLKAEPQNEEVFQTVLRALDDLGIYQGSVLTYARYLIVLVSKYSR